VNEVVRPAPPRRRFQELLPDPSGRWIGGDIETDEFPPLVADEKEDVKDPEAQGLEHEQVGSPNASKLKIEPRLR